MAYLPITLSVARAPDDGARSAMAGTGRKGGQSPRFETDSAIMTDEEVLERDQQTCRFCGFQAQKYQSVVALDGNWRNRSDKNLATACVFCRQCFDLHEVAAMRSGVLIWLPEIGQAALHHIARAIYVARISSGPVADAARAALDGLMNRRAEVKKRLGSDDPAALAAVLSDFLEDDAYRQRGKKLDGIRLMPLDRRIVREGEMEFNQFPQILAFWRSKDGPLGATPPATWEERFQSLVQAA